MVGMDCQPSGWEAATEAHNFAKYSIIIFTFTAQTYWFCWFVCYQLTAAALEAEKIRVHMICSYAARKSEVGSGLGVFPLETFFISHEAT